MTEFEMKVPGHIRLFAEGSDADIRYAFLRNDHTHYRWIMTDMEEHGRLYGPAITQHYPAAAKAINEGLGRLTGDRDCAPQAAKFLRETIACPQLLARVDPAMLERVVSMWPDERPDLSPPDRQVVELAQAIAALPRAPYHTAFYAGFTGLLPAQQARIMRLAEHAATRDAYQLLSGVIPIDSLARPRSRQPRP